jgi:hypothetical protein
MLRKAEASDPLRGPRDEPDDKKLSASLDEIVAEMLVAAPSLHPNRARRWLLHTPHGRELLLQHTTRKAIMPQVNMQKLVSTMEDALMASVTKRDGESYAQSFARKYESDIDFRRQWSTVSEAKQLMALKGMATLTPTSVEVGDTNVSDSSAEAVRLLSEMAAKNGRAFEVEFADPANAKLASRTYTSAHRSSINTDYLEQ